MNDNDLRDRLGRLLKLYRASHDGRVVLDATGGDEVDSMTLGDLRAIADMIGA
jgi:hypothetical protein